MKPKQSNQRTKDILAAFRKAATGLTAEAIAAELNAGFLHLKNKISMFSIYKYRDAGRDERPINGETLLALEEWTKQKNKK